MNEATIYVRTNLANTELQNPKGSIAGDEKRLLLLVDGKTNVEAIGKKVPPSVRAQLEEVFKRLTQAKFIVEVSATSAAVSKVPDATPANVKTPARISHVEVQNILNTSQKLNKNMMLLAEVEIERRMELEQDLAEVNSKCETLQSRLNEAEAQKNAISDQYETLKQQVLVYKQGMQSKVLALQAHIQQNQGVSQDSQAQRSKAEADLNKMRDDFERLQADMAAKELSVDKVLKLRMQEEKRVEELKRTQSKIEADEMVREHPHYHEVRRLDFFKDFRNSDLAQLMVWADWREIKAGETVVVEGEQDVTFFVLVSGKMAVVKGKRTIHVLMPGDPFGEIASLDLDNSLRSASVIARTDCALLAINPAHLDGAEVIIRMRVSEALVRIQAKRLRRAIDMVESLLADDADK